jgi:hypothetical protein
MIRDNDGNIIFVNSEGTRLNFNKIAHPETCCQGWKWHGQGNDGEAVERGWAGMTK